jgi:hypothetical protein
MRTCIKAAATSLAASAAAMPQRAEADLNPANMADQVTVTVGGALDADVIYLTSIPCNVFNNPSNSTPIIGGDGGCGINLNGQAFNAIYVFNPAKGVTGPSADPKGVSYENSLSGSDTSFASATLTVGSAITTADGTSGYKETLSFLPNPLFKATAASQFQSTGERQYIAGVSNSKTSVLSPDSADRSFTDPNADPNYGRVTVWLTAFDLPFTPDPNTPPLLDKRWCNFSPYTVSTQQGSFGKGDYVYSTQGTSPDGQGNSLTSFETSAGTFTVRQITLKATCPPPSTSSPPPASGGSSGGGGGGAIDGTTLLALAGAGAIAALRRRQNLAAQLHRKPSALNVA